MSGIAKTLFEELNKRTPWKEFCQSRTVPEWPFLSRLLSEQALPYLNFFLAECFWRRNPEIIQEVAALICHLTLAAHQGHLCVRIDGGNVSPPPAQIWSQDTLSLPTPDDFNILTQMIIKGADRFPNEMITNIKLGDSYKKVTTPFCKLENFFYLQKYWTYETSFVMHLQRVLCSKPSIEFNYTALKDHVEKLVNQGVLLVQQAEAILKVSDKTVSIITGGPGTGKTYTAGQLIKVYWESLQPHQQNQFEIVLAAPTGKAAANLQKSLNVVVGDLKGFKPLVAKTLHNLLNIERVGRNSDHVESSLSADLILVDESSMIDIRLMGCLFRAIKAGARVILLGDRYQLPSVEAGGILGDLIGYHNESKRGLVACTELNVCMRTELKGILAFADAINKGDVDRVLGMLEAEDENIGITRLNLGEDRKSRQKLINHLGDIFCGGFDHIEEPKKLMEQFNRVRILSAVRKGVFGVDELNAYLLDHYKRKSHGKECFVSPIMIVSNDYRQNLFNGETGLLIRRNKHDKEYFIGSEDYAIFPSRDGGEERRISAVLLPKYEYAYCLSIHKSQGSEFERVILMMSDGSEWFGREIFYTGVTRAKKCLEVYGSDEILRSVVERQSVRLSGLQSRLRDSID